MSCRICLGTDNLIIACECIGDFEKIHNKCLNEWLESTGNRFCDLCGYKYRMNKKYKNRFDWLSDRTDELETLIEITAKTVQIWHCYILGWIMSSLVGTNVWTISSLNAILFFRLFNICYIWTQFVLKLIYDYREWRQNNYTIEVQPNPDRHQ